MSKLKSKESTFLGTDEFSNTDEYRKAINVFEKLEKYELQENISWYSTNWLLSTDDIKLSIDLPNGLCKYMPTELKDLAVLLFPCPEEEMELDYREVYQMIRELTVGMYGCNQIPGIELEANFDRATQCDLPPIYYNTRIGQHLINVDYAMKCLWHGTYFSSQRRNKWGEKWRSTLAVNAITGNPDTKRDIFEEFVSSGMVSVAEENEYKDAYSHYVDILNRERLFASETKTIFQKHLSHIGMKINMFPTDIKCEGEVFLSDSDWKIEAIFKGIREDLPQEETEIMLNILQIQRDIIAANLDRKPEIRTSLYKLKLLATLIPLFIGMRKQMAIPDLNKLMNPLMGDEVKTEKELPPLMVGPNYPNILFDSSKYFSLHGGVQFGLSTNDVVKGLPSLLKTEKIQKEIDKVTQEACLVALSESTYTDKNPVRKIVDSSGKKYYLIPIFLERFYSQAPKIPNWVRAISTETEKLQERKLPLSDDNVFDQFKRIYGLQAAFGKKKILEALSSCSKRGMVAMLQTECKKCSITTVSKQDSLGWSLMHHAAINNKTHIIGALLLQSQDVNIRRYNTVTETSPTPLHAAVVCGSLYAATCLVSCNANLKSGDKLGWMPVHCAAYYDQMVILQMLIRQDRDLINIATRNKLQQTPILLAASAGSLACLQLLISAGAYIDAKDSEGKSVIHLAVLSFKNKILEYLIKLNNPKIQPWPILLEMLQSNNAVYIQKTVECLEYMTKYSKGHEKNILKYDLVPAIVQLLIKEDIKLLLSITSLLCNVCVNPEIQQELQKTDIISILVELFVHEELTLHSQLAFIVDYLCRLELCQSQFTKLEGHKRLERTIVKAATDIIANVSVLVNAMNAVNSLCRNNSENQDLVVNETKLVKYIIDFISLRGELENEDLLAASSFAVSSLVKNKTRNQDIFVENQCVMPLLRLIKYRSNVKVQVAASNATEQLCYGNVKCRIEFRALETEKYLINLLKIWSVEVKEQGVRSLWALAGDHITGQRFIAESIGASLLIELLMTKSETLQSIGCKAMSALCKELKQNQDKILSEGGIQPLVRLLRTAPSNNVLYTAVETIGILCLGIAHCSNRIVQTQIVAENALTTLVDLFNRPNTEIYLKVEIGYTLAAITLNHKVNEQKMSSIFNFCDLMTLTEDITENKLLLRCLTSIAIFCFNNTHNQFEVKEHGGIDFSLLEIFLSSTDPLENIQTAFNMTVLARVVNNHDHVSITACAVKTLVGKLGYNEPHVIILTASLIASLCHTRAGIPDAFVSLNAVDGLLTLLHSNNVQVRSAVSVALGYLSFNGTAARAMLRQCRINFNLFDKLYCEIEKMGSKISSEFVDDYKKTEKVGLPYKYLECNGGYPIYPSRFRIKSSTVEKGRSDISVSFKQNNSRKKRPMTVAVVTRDRKSP